MSIIEKAANKLGVVPEAPQKQSASAESMIESALNKQRTTAPEPLIAAPVEAVASTRHAPERLGNSQFQSINLARLHRMGVVSPDAEKARSPKSFALSNGH